MPITSSRLTFAGFSNPNYTQVPDELFDQLLPQLGDSELRVLLYIIRRTFGFKRESDTISLSQMVSGITTRDGQVLDSGTGLSKATVARGLKGLRDKGIIVAERQRTVDRGDQPTSYSLRFCSDHSKISAAEASVSQQQDTPRVSAMRQAVSQSRDTQETGEQETDFELSKRENVDKWEEASRSNSRQRASNTYQSSSLEEGSLAILLRHRVRRDVGGNDRAAIGVTIERFASELGDQAESKSSISRALNLYQASGAPLDGFIDALYRAKGETLDRRSHPGKAPLPRNCMAYFFAVVEDRLGLKPA